MSWQTLDVVADEDTAKTLIQWRERNTRWWDGYEFRHIKAPDGEHGYLVQARRKQ